jgi:hypothetical protein
MTDARLLPLGFTMGVVGAFVGHLLGGHEGDWIYHLPHQALLGIPLAILGALLLKPEPRDITLCAAWGGMGLAAGAALLALT